MRKKMLNWIVVGMLLILLVIFLKVRHFKHRTYILLGVLLIIFFYISASHVISDQNLNLKTFDGVMKAGKLYLSWLIHIGGNIKELGGSAIKMNWVGNITK